MTSPAYKANYGLIDWSGLKPRQRKPRAPVARSGLSCPMIVRTFAEPVQSMADGKYYDTPRDLERTYRADGNPFGQEFIALGNESLPTVEYDADGSIRREHIRQAVQDVRNGNIPPEIAAIT